MPDPTLPAGTSVRDLDEPPLPPCPGPCWACKAETWNATPDYDGERVTWTYLLCDDCEASR